MKELKLEIEVLEERIAPIVHPFVGGVLATAIAASGGAAGGAAAFGVISTSAQVGVPVPLSTPGVGPSP